MGIFVTWEETLPPAGATQEPLTTRQGFINWVTHLQFRPEQEASTGHGYKGMPECVSLN